MKIHIYQFAGYIKVRYMIVKHKILAAQKVVKAVNVVRVVRVVRVVKHTDNLQLKTCPQFFRHCAETGVLLLILIFTSCFFNSCDNRKDPYTGLDNTPVLTVQKLDSVKTCTYLTDSMKIGKPYVFKYNIISFENLPLNIVKTQVTDSVVVSNNLVYVNRLTEGLSEYFLKTTDPFGKAANANVAITFFINLPPVCEFTVTQAGMSIPCEIDINASSSYDQDSRWGGEVINYEYIIGTDYDTKTVLNNIQYIFDGPGQKKITVLCQDNNGTWSSPNTIYFSVTASDTTQNLIKKLSTK